MFNIDTLDLSKKLHTAGLNKKIAEALAEELKQAGQKSMDNLATKNDIKILKKDIELLQARMDQRFISFNKEIKNSLNIVDQKFISSHKETKNNFNIVDQRFISLKEKMDQRFARVDQKFISLEEKMDQKFAVMDQKFISLKKDFKVYMFTMAITIGTFTALVEKFIN